MQGLKGARAIFSKSGHHIALTEQYFSKCRQSTEANRKQRAFPALGHLTAALPGALPSRFLHVHREVPVLTTAQLEFKAVAPGSITLNA